MTEYRAILYTDTDVDLGSPVPSALTPTPAARKAWTAALQEFLDGPQLLAASRDAHSPVNGGILLIKPSESAYDFGVGVLRRRRFNVSHGFDLAGPPRQQMHAGMVSRWARGRMKRAYLASHMLRDNTWDFVGANSDQGLFSFVYLLKLHALHQNRHHTKCAYRLRHFWGVGKPWLRPGETACISYFSFLETPAPHGHEMNGTSTVRSLTHSIPSICRPWLMARLAAYKLSQPASSVHTCTGFNLQCFL